MPPSGTRTPGQWPADVTARRGRLPRQDHRPEATCLDAMALVPERLQGREARQHLHWRQAVRHGRRDRWVHRCVHAPSAKWAAASSGRIAKATGTRHAAQRTPSEPDRGGPTPRRWT